MRRGNFTRELLDEEPGEHGNVRLQLAALTREDGS